MSADSIPTDTEVPSTEAPTTVVTPTTVLPETTTVTQESIPPPSPTTTSVDAGCLDITQQPIACDDLVPCLASPLIPCCLDIQQNVIDCADLNPCLASPVIPCTTTTTIALVGVPPTLPSTGSNAVPLVGVGFAALVIGALVLRFRRPKVRSTFHPVVTAQEPEVIHISDLYN